MNTDHRSEVHRFSKYSGSHERTCFSASKTGLLGESPGWLPGRIPPRESESGSSVHTQSHRVLLKGKRAGPGSDPMRFPSCTVDRAELSPHPQCTAVCELRGSTHGFLRRAREASA